MSYLAKPLLFQLDAERAHNMALGVAEFASRWPWLTNMVASSYKRTDPRLQADRFALHFRNPIGLAAGLDKNSLAVPYWEALGFGFVEVGTVTPGYGQPGNERPRLWRLPEHRAVVNRMGFNNAGAIPLSARLCVQRPRVTIPIGVNIGKAKNTSLADASRDYVTAMSQVWDVADYITINVSSPNTEGLRTLQENMKLVLLVEELITENQRLGRIAGVLSKPLFLKIAPDLSNEDLDAVADMALHHPAVSALIATNTTIGLAGLTTQKGGISGAPLKEMALGVVRRLYRRVGRKVPIIGVGGIETADDVYLRLRAGACLVQLYTALVYEGPGLVGQLLDGLGKLLERDGIHNLQDIIGVDVQ